MNKTILKLAAAAAASMVMASGTAYAQEAAACKGADVASSATAERVNTFEGDAECYVVTTFGFNLSNGVALKAEQNRNAIAVATSTPRGRNQFSGSSNGGSVATCGPATTGNKEPEITAPSLEPDAVNGCGVAAAATGT